MFDIISMRDFTKEGILEVLDLAADVKEALYTRKSGSGEFKRKYGLNMTDLLSQTRVATLFLENSTRTFFSSRAAVGLAGGEVDGFPTPDNTSLKKGETLAETMLTFADYFYDAIVMRSTAEGLPRWIRDYLDHQNDLELHQNQLLGFPYPPERVMIVNEGGPYHLYHGVVLRKYDIYTHKIRLDGGYDVTFFDSYIVLINNSNKPLVNCNNSYCYWCNSKLKKHYPIKKIICLKYCPNCLR